MAMAHPPTEPGQLVERVSEKKRERWGRRKAHSASPLITILRPRPPRAGSAHSGRRLRVAIGESRNLRPRTRGSIAVAGRGTGARAGDNEARRGTMIGL